MLIELIIITLTIQWWAVRTDRSLFALLAGFLDNRSPGENCNVRTAKKIIERLVFRWLQQHFTTSLLERTKFNHTSWSNYNAVIAIEITPMMRKACMHSLSLPLTSTVIAYFNDPHNYVDSFFIMQRNILTMYFYFFTYLNNYQGSWEGLYPTWGWPCISSVEC